MTNTKTQTRDVWVYPAMLALYHGTKADGDSSAYHTYQNVRDCMEIAHSDIRRLRAALELANEQLRAIDGPRLGLDDARNAVDHALKTVTTA